MITIGAKHRKKCFRSWIRDMKESFKSVPSSIICRWLRALSILVQGNSGTRGVEEFSQLALMCLLVGFAIVHSCIENIYLSHKQKFITYIYINRFGYMICTPGKVYGGNLWNNMSRNVGCVTFFASRNIYRRWFCGSWSPRTLSIILVMGCMLYISN